MARTLVKTINDTPVGSIKSYAGTSIPLGWLLCNGASLSRTTYADLFAVIGTAWGTANVSSFNLPDFRGRFLRGVDGGAGRDPDRASRTVSNTGGSTGDNVGSIQGNAFQTHTHTQNTHTHTQDSHNHTQNSHNHSQNSHNHSSSTDTTGAHGHALQIDLSANTFAQTDGGGYLEFGGITVGRDASAEDPFLFSGIASAGSHEHVVTNVATTAVNVAATATNIASTATNQNTIAVNQNATASGTHAQATANETRPVNANVHFIIKY